MADKIRDFYRGDSKKYKFTFLSKATGDAKHLDGYALFFTLKKEKEDPDDSALISKRSTNTVDPETGVIEVELTPEDTSIDPGNYHYDFQLVNGTGSFVKTILVGKVKVLRDITLRTT